MGFILNLTHSLWLTLLFGFSSLYASGNNDNSPVRLRTSRFSFADYHLGPYSAGETTSIKAKMAELITNFATKSIPLHCHASGQQLASTKDWQMAIHRPRGEVVVLSKPKIQQINTIIADIKAFAKTPLALKSSHWDNLVREKNWGDTELAVALNSLDLYNIQYISTLFTGICARFQMSPPAEVLHFLLQKGADPLFYDQRIPLQNYFTPLKIAFSSNKTLAGMIIRKIESPEFWPRYKTIFTFLGLATKANQTQELYKLFSLGLCPLHELNLEDTPSCVFHAASYNALDSLKLILGHLRRNNTPPHDIKRLVNAPYQGLSPLAIAAMAENKEIVSVLIENGASTQLVEGGTIPPLLAAMRGRSRLYSVHPRYLADDGVNKNCGDQLMIVKLLLDNGADWSDPFDLQEVNNNNIAGGGFKEIFTSPCIFLFNNHNADFSRQCMRKFESTISGEKACSELENSWVKIAVYPLLLAIDSSAPELASHFLRKDLATKCWEYRTRNSPHWTTENIFTYLTYHPEKSLNKLLKLDHDIVAAILSDSSVYGVPIICHLALDEKTAPLVESFFRQVSIEKIFKNSPEIRAFLEKIISPCSLSTETMPLENEPSFSDDEPIETDQSEEAIAVEPETIFATTTSSSSSLTSPAKSESPSKRKQHLLFVKSRDRLKKAFIHWKETSFLTQRATQEQDLVAILECIDHELLATKELPQYPEILKTCSEIAKYLLQHLGERGQMGHAYKYFHAHHTRDGVLQQRVIEENLRFNASRFSAEGILATLRARGEIAKWILSEHERLRREAPTEIQRFVGTFIVDNVQGICCDSTMNIVYSDAVRAVVDIDPQGKFTLVTMYPQVTFDAENMPRSFQPKQVEKQPDFSGLMSRKNY